MNTLALAALGILAVQPASLFSISFNSRSLAVLSIVYGLDRMQAARSDALPGWRGGQRKSGAACWVFFGVSLVATWGTLALVCTIFQHRVLHRVAGERCRDSPDRVRRRRAGVGRHAARAFEHRGGCGLLPDQRFCSFQIHRPPGTHGGAALCRDPDGESLGCGTGSVLPIELGGIPSRHRANLGGGSSSNAAATGRATSAGDPSHAMPGHLRRFFFQTIRCASPDGKAAAAVLVLCLIGAGTDVGYWIYQRFGRQDLRLTLLDVGQGSAVCWSFPGGATALVDGGGFADMAALTWAPTFVAPLPVAPENRHDRHSGPDPPNSDHLNGLPYAANFHVRSLWTNGESRPMPGYAGLDANGAGTGHSPAAVGGHPAANAINDAQLKCCTSGGFSGACGGRPLALG